MKISAIQLAQVKRIAQNISSLEKKRQATQAKINKLQEELNTIKEGIETWETPVKAMTGGRTSSEILIKEDNKYVINPEIVKQEGSSYEILGTIDPFLGIKEEQNVEEKTETIKVLESANDSATTSFQEEKAEREGTTEETTIVPDAEENNWTNF